MPSIVILSGVAVVVVVVPDVEGVVVGVVVAGGVAVTG
jgi:hypothetical protein